MFLSFVIAVFPNYLDDYYSVVNPSNILINDKTYALATYTYSMVCPEGNFYPNPVYPTRFCNEEDTGYVISGWETVVFNNSVLNSTKIKLRISNQNDGCSTGCNDTTSALVFN